MPLVFKIQDPLYTILSVLAHMHDQLWYPLKTQGKLKGVAWTIRHGKSNKGRGPPWVPE